MNMLELMTRVHNASTLPMVWEARTHLDMVRETTIFQSGMCLDKCYKEYYLGDTNPEMHMKIYVYPQGLYGDDVRAVIMPLQMMKNAEIVLKFEHGKVHIEFGDNGKLITRLRAVLMVQDIWRKKFYKTDAKKSTG